MSGAFSDEAPDHEPGWAFMHFEYDFRQHYSPVESWAPLVNMYRLADRIELAVDLAGVERGSLSIELTPGRLTLTGIRRPPEPRRAAGEPMEVMEMEIDHGPFGRRIALPEGIDLEAAASEYVKGLLWIRLPFAGTP